MKILFYCSHPTQSNGYARIGNNITNYFASCKNIDLYYFGITGFKESRVDRFINPKIKLIEVFEESPSKNPYGDDLIVSKIKEIQPDIVFLYNDILVIARIINEIKTLPKTFQIYTYIDLVYEFERSEIIKYIDIFTDKFFVFSECWKENLSRLQINQSKIFVLHHGIDYSRIYKTNQEQSRKMFNFLPEDFIILNLNRNTHRKAIDITIRAFLIFLQKHQSDPRIKLFLNGIMENSSYPNLEIIKIECNRLGLDFNNISTHHIMINQNIISDFELNHLYNATDLGINTCFGEGFGLCNLEHASVGKAQIASKVGALKDIFVEGHAKLIEPVTRIYSPIALELTGGYMEICRAEDFAEALDYYYLHPQDRLDDGKFYEQKIPDVYDWNHILKEFIDKHLS
jgi:glycosyltransferase involved in cell wall biosynthesis